MAADATVFFGLWLQKPLRIASTNPSGSRLADAIARCVELDRRGPVLELGAGTGSLTRGLLRAGCPRDRSSRSSASRASPRRCARIPGIATIVGDATALTDHFAGRGVDRLSAVVSSLPIKWFPVAAQRAIVAPCLARLGSGRPLSADDQRVFVADRDRAARHRRRAGRLCLAQPAAGPDLGLFRSERSPRMDRREPISPIAQT